MGKNICHFIPCHSDYNSIHTVNMVYETEHKIAKSLQSLGLYRMHYIHSGIGKLHMPGREIIVNRDEVFFSFPDTSFYFEPLSDDFSYMYISYIGSRGTMIMDKIGIAYDNFIFKGCEGVRSLWEKAVDSDAEVSEWMAESVLLYTFSQLCIKLHPCRKQKEHGTSLPDMIKKYIDDNFTDENMSLEMISKGLSYSPKYISSVFKKYFEIGISEYLVTVRMQHACNLMAQGFTAISDIAVQCGYGDAQYFSRVFAHRYGMSPKNFIKSKNNRDGKI